MSLNSCDFCKKSFSRKSNCQTHLLTCKVKREKDHLDLCNEVQILKTENNKLHSEVISLRKELELYKNIIDSKQTDKNNSHVINNAQQQINIFNTTPPTSLKDLVNNLEPINFDEIKTSFENDFTHKYIDKGMEGFASFLCDVPCKNKIITTDFSRKIVSYKTSPQQVVLDPYASILLNTTLKQNAQTIFEKTEERRLYWDEIIKKTEDDDDCQDERRKRSQASRIFKNAAHAQNNLPLKAKEAMDFILMKGVENRNNINAIE